MFNKKTVESRLREDAIRQYITSQLKDNEKTLEELSKAFLPDTLIKQPPTVREIQEVIYKLERGNYISQGKKGKYKIIPLII